MKIDDKIRDKKLQYDINRKAAKIPASGKIDKHEDFTGKKILPPHQKRVTKQAEFIYSPLGKDLEKQKKKQLKIKVKKNKTNEST